MDNEREYDKWINKDQDQEDDDESEDDDYD